MTQTPRAGHTDSKTNIRTRPATVLDPTRNLRQVPRRETNFQKSKFLKFQQNPTKKEQIFKLVFLLDPKVRWRLDFGEISEISIFK